MQKKKKLRKTTKLIDVARLYVQIRLRTEFLAIQFGTTIKTEAGIGKFHKVNMHNMHKGYRKQP